MPSTDKLTILFLAANPEKTDRVKLDEEAHAIDDVLRRAEFRIFDLRTHWALRYGDLPELLLRYNPHIVHFSGHGSTLGDIALQDNSGKMHLVPPDALAALFRTLKDNIRCVVLNACYSQIQAEGIAKSIDFVVGMNREIKDTAAINFAAGFYRGLGYGRTIKTAFDLGCIEIGLAGIVQTSTRPPVVVGEQRGTPVLGGTAAIPQLVALRSDPAKVTLLDESGGQEKAGKKTIPPLVMLSGKQYGDLQNSLVAAFDNETLPNMVKLCLEQDLTAIAGGSTRRAVAFNLIGWAQRTGKLTELISCAYEANPDSPELKAFVASL